MQEKNPYAAPAAPVDDVVHAASIGELIEGGRRVPSGNSWLWIAKGFGLFKASPGVWILIVIILFAISWLLSVLPFGSLALNLITPVFVGGLMLGCHAQAQGEPLEVAHLFAGFRERTGPLVLVGVLYLIGVIAAMLIASLIFGASILMSGLAVAATTLAPVTIALFALVVLALLVPLGMAVWFAPALVLFHDAAPVDAMKQSFLASLRNMIPFLLYGIILLCLGVVASIPLFLGWLVLIPTAICSTYYSYRDIFINEL
jgi:uncharacterized membrane protein